jgi:single-stranded-DNA-specific exonuclease
MNILNQCKELLSHWGGHPAAVGLSLKEENLEKFKKSFLLSVNKETSGKLPESTLKIAATIKENELQDSLIDDLDKLAPFGQENPEPILALKNVSLAYEPKKVGSGNHFQFSVFNGSRNISGIAWNMSENMPSSTTPIDLAFKLRWNHWHGRKTPQMVLEDWKVSG